MVPNLHRHPHGTLFLLRSGYLKSESAGGRWIIPAGHLCWVPPYSMHGAEMVGVQGIRLHLARQLCETLPSQPRVMKFTPLILAIIDRLAASTGARKRLMPQEKRLLAVLLDEIERARSTPLLLPMPQASRLRDVAEKWLHHPDDPSGLDERDCPWESGVKWRD